MPEPGPTPTRIMKRWFHRARPLPHHDARTRTTAFVYGNIVVLAALVQVSLHEITGGSVVTVLATAVSTFLVHVFAGVITTSWSMSRVRREARDSTPILTSGLLPAAILLTTVMFGVSSVLSVALAQAVVIVRTALIGMVVARLRSEPATPGTVLSGLGLALLAFAIVVTKVVLIH